MKILKRFVALMIAAVMIMNGQAVYAWVTDDFIFSDPVDRTFVGHREGAQLVWNLRFTDMPGSAAAQDAIVRSGAYNFIKGEAPLFRPNAPMTIQESLAFALRAGGFEEQALAAAGAEMDVLPIGATAQDVIYLGYLALARDMGLITADQFTEAFEPPLEDEPDLPEGFEVETFRRTDPATREEFAHWLALAVNARSSTAFNIQGPSTFQQSIYGFVDWNEISPERLQSVEQISRTGVMTGDNNLFRPQALISRMEAAWAGRALDTIFHGIAGLARYYGTVGAISDAQAVTGHTGELWRDIRVRRQDGLVDILRYTRQAGGSPQTGSMDAVVLRHGVVGGLGILEVGDRIEYIVHPETETVMYVVVTGALHSGWVQGMLQTVNDEAGTATFLDQSIMAGGVAQTFALAQGLLRQGQTGPELRLDTDWVPLSEMPFGRYFAIYLVNNLITEIHFLGGLVIAPETWGVVIENIPGLGILTVRNSMGFVQTFYYLASDIDVQVIEHWDMRDTIGGIHALFPEMRPNPRLTNMDAIRVGHIVSFRTDPADPDRIISINASSNYTTFYGQILDVITSPAGATDVLFRFQDGITTSLIPMASLVPVRRNGIPANIETIGSYEWARLLVNQAVVGPGEVAESVIAINLEGPARDTTRVLRGRLRRIDRIQNQMILEDVQELQGGSFIPYRQVAQFSIAHPQIQYFLYDAPVTLGFISEFFVHTSPWVYLDIESSHGGERIQSANFQTPNSYFNIPRP